jgi:hypothetical protein
MLRFAFLFTIPLIASAFATSFYERPFPDTVRSTPTIVRGKIGKSRTEWTTLPDGSRHLFTYYDVDVSEGFKGVPRTGAPIRIREIGGSKDGVSLNVSGTAVFEKGEDVVVLLGRAGMESDGTYPVMGMMMGKFDIEKGEDGKEYLRGPGLGSSVLPGLRNEDSNKKTVQVSLEGLREIIRTQAKAAKAEPSVASTPRKSGGGLLSARSQPAPRPRTEIHDENLRTPVSGGGTSRRAYISAAGALLGIAWFLKSRRKRR